MCSGCDSLTVVFQLLRRLNNDTVLKCGLEKRRTTWIRCKVLVNKKVLRIRCFMKNKNRVLEFDFLVNQL